MSDEDFEKIDDVKLNKNDDTDNKQSSSDELKSGDRVAPGKTINKKGQIEKSKGREIVDGVGNAVEIGAAIASGGATAGAAAEGTAASGAASGASNAAKASPKGPTAKNLTSAPKGNAPIKKQISNRSSKPKLDQLTKEEAQEEVKDEAKEGLIDKAKNKVADKIDKKAERNPFFRKKVEKMADDAKVLNGGVDAVKSALSGDIRGTKQGIEKAVSGITSKAKRKIKLMFATVCISFFLIMVVMEMAIGPLKDAWQNFDSDARKIANNVEKLSNLYRGFGYQDSKTAFYKELNNLDKFYDYKLDMALLLSTLFYTESMGYDTSYQDHLKVIENDPITSGLTSGVEGTLDYFKSWIEDVLEDSSTTYDKNGLAYNAGKIYRLRRLTAAMCDRSGTSQEISLSDFLEKYDYMLSTSVMNVLNTKYNTIWTYIKETISIVLKEIYDVVTLNFSDLGSNFEEFKDNVKEAGIELSTAIATLLNVVTFGLFEITQVDFNFKEGITISYIPYKVNYDKYDEYLKTYYFEDTPEFNKLLPTNTTQRESKKTKILNEIYENKRLFEDIFLKQLNASSESYENSCVGAIDTNLVNELSLPIDVASDKTISFDSNDSYGIVNSKVHNGVDLNETSAGIVEGSKVYSIQDGKVTKVTGESKKKKDDDPESGGTAIKIKHNIKINETSYTFYSVYKNLNSKSVTLKKGDSVSKGDTIGTVGKTKNKEVQLHFEFRNEKDEAIDPTNLFIKCTNNLANTGGSYPGDSNEAQIINNLLNEGFNYVQIAAIITNMFYESSYNPSALNSLGCKGISQWCFGREKNLVNYTSSKKENWSNLALQLTFLNAEIKNTGDAVSYASQNSISIISYKNTVDYIGDNYSDDKVDDAVHYYCMHFEVPGKSECDKRIKADSNGNTVGKQWLDDIKTNVKKSTDSTNTNNNTTNNTNTNNSDNSYGTDIVTEASKYVGNPYVWGGESLTNGCDCSHFVWLVLLELGYNITYQPTYAWNQGTQISINEAQPGDVFVYNVSTSNGHMGFIGNNDNIIEAQGSSTGITSNRSWSDYKNRSNLKVYRMYSTNIK